MVERQREDARGRMHVVDPLAREDWDHLVRRVPGSTFFHGAAWARVLHETYGFVPMYLVKFEGGRLKALLPCMEVDTFPGGRRAVCLPFTDLVPPVLDEGEPLSAVTETLNARGRERGWLSWETRGGFHELPGAVSSLEFHQHSLELTPGPATLFCGFDPAVRRALRKAARSAMVVRVDRSSEAMKSFYALHCRTRRKHGLPPQPWTFFQNIQRHVLAEGQGQLVLAYQQQRAVAGAVFFHWDKEVFYKFGASDDTRLDLRPNNHVLWHAIESYSFDGFDRLHLGRTSLTNAGLRRYKLSWGAAESPLAYVKYDLMRNRYVRDTDRTKGWHTAALRCLPVPLLRAVGALLYRHTA